MADKAAGRAEGAEWAVRVRPQPGKTRNASKIDGRGGDYSTVGFEAVESGLSASMGARVAFVNRATAQ
jgi:hypothetical protein